MTCLGTWQDWQPDRDWVRKMADNLGDEWKVCCPLSPAAASPKACNVLYANLSLSLRILNPRSLPPPPYPLRQQDDANPLTFVGDEWSDRRSLDQVCSLDQVFFCLRLFFPSLLPDHSPIGAGGVCESLLSVRRCVWRNRVRRRTCCCPSNSWL